MEDLGKLIVAKGFKSCPKSNKSPNLVTLLSCSKLLQLFVNKDCTAKVAQKWGKENAISVLTPIVKPKMVGPNDVHSRVTLQEVPWRLQNS